MARSDGKRIHWPDPTHSRAGEADLLGHGRHKWRAAREIIDWSIEGKSIFDRKRPLSRKTLARIYAGAVKFRWPAPFLVILRNHMDAQSVDEPVPTLCAGGSHIGLAQPFLLNRHGENGSTRAHDLDEPMPTADCRGAGYLCEPFVANLAHAGADESRCRTIGEPLQTLHAGGGSHALVEPFIMSGQSGGAPREISDPMPGMTGRLGSVLIAPYYGWPWLRRKLLESRVSAADRDDQGQIRACGSGDPQQWRSGAQIYRRSSADADHGQGRRICRRHAGDPRRWRQPSSDRRRAAADSDRRAPRRTRLHRGRPLFPARGMVWRTQGPGAPDPLGRRSGSDDLRPAACPARGADLQGPEIRHSVPHARAERACPRDGLLGRGDGLRIRRQQDRNHQADRQCRPRQSRRRTGWRLDAELKSAVAYGREPSNDGSHEAAPDKRRLINP